MAGRRRLRGPPQARLTTADHPSAGAHHARAVDDLLEESWERRGRPIRGRELGVEMAVNAAFAAANAALIIAVPPATAPHVAVVALVAAYAVAARVEFPIGVASFVPTQLLLVPMFVLAPAQLVPSLVFAAYLLAAVAAALRGHARFDRVVFCAGDAAHALGPAVVFTVMSDGNAAESTVGVIALAFAAQVVVDLASSSVHDLLAIGAPAPLHLRVMVEIWAADLALGSVGLVVAAASVERPWAALAPLPLVLLLRQIASDRTRRIDAAHDRLRALERETGQRQAAAALLERQNQFLSDVSHELRTPVTIARGFLETLDRARGATAESRVALDELQRIERIVERLLVLARSEHPGAGSREEVDAESLVEDRFVRWSDTTPRPWRLGPVASGTVVGDGDALRAALDALLENAVNHTTPAQAIELRSESLGDRLVVHVADEGSGIPEDQLDGIFERFARADPARTRRAGGAGLGLAIVAAVAKGHGGECTVESSPTGSTFSLRVAGFQARPSRAAHG